MEKDPIEGLLVVQLSAGCMWWGGPEIWSPNVTEDEP